MNTHYSKGISLIEVMVVIGIIVLLAAITVPVLSNFRDQQALRNTTEDLLSLLNQARSDTLGSLNATNYSVSIDSDHATYFAGETFSSNDPANTVITFNPAVTVSASTGVSLNGGGNVVTFDRLTGDTETYGTIIIQLISDPTQQKTITIQKTGLVSSN